ncbi:hypothetical protein TI04_02585 [Achromatium sp. WMS2]|nr:hypothetical protein TI04_02585 [Achromatium sp. WMS2]
MVFNTNIRAEGAFVSSYTTIDPDFCSEFTEIDVAASRSKCPSFGDIGVIIDDSDERHSITLVRNNILYPLNFYETVTTAMSTLGSKKMEWRYPMGDPQHPVAMLVRLNVGTNDSQEQQVSYLVVTKITERQICVVGIIPPKFNQNFLARNMADQAYSMPCRTTVLP